MAYFIGVIKRPLQGLHAAQAAADNGRELLNTQMLGQLCLCFDPVFNGDDREIRAVMFACSGVNTCRPG